MPYTAVAVIVLIVGSIIGSGKNEILQSGLSITAAVFCLHLCGFLSGLILSIVLGKDMTTAKTISVEVGMQNSGLGIVLARQHFIDPQVAIPSALSSVFHNIIASFFAALWKKK